jgi:BirA family transcriptional regulator, biotin operon repressor / biotin---[acetyl-CoA-carboxylase] ligase
LNQSGILHFVGVVPSTMATAREMVVSGLMSPGDAVLATRQTAGIGRMGRTWQAEPDSALLMTAYRRTSLHPAHLGLVAIVAAVVVADLLADHGVDPRIKWPNDVLIDDAKVAGILIQTAIGTAGIDVYAGFGVNLTGVAKGLAASATCLGDHVGVVPGSDSLARTLLSSWSSEMEQLERGETDVLRRWRDRAAWIDLPVTVHAGEELTGILRGIDAKGQLIIETAFGQRNVAVGEVTRGPRQAG